MAGWKRVSTLLLITVVSAWGAGVAAAGTDGPEGVRADLRQGRYDAAEAGARALLKEAGRRDGLDSVATAEALDLLVESLQRSGRFMGPEPRALAERAVEIRERSLPPYDPSLANSLEP